MTKRCNDERRRLFWLKELDTYDFSSFTDDVLAFPDHGNDGSGREVLDESGEEGASLQIIVVLSGEGFSGDDDLNGNELVSLLFETVDDFGDLFNRERKEVLSSFVH